MNCLILAVKQYMLRFKVINLLCYIIERRLLNSLLTILTTIRYYTAQFER